MFCLGKTASLHSADYMHLRGLTLFVLHSGSRSGLIHQHDVRVADHHIFTFGGHTQEVCGLTWSPDGKYLASGGNDNMVYIWPMTTGSEYQAIHALSEHQGAVKVT